MGKNKITSNGKPFTSVTPFKPYKAPKRIDAQILAEIEAAFDPEALTRICEMTEYEFADAYAMTVTGVNQPAPNHFFAYVDNGSDILAVAHLDTVAHSWARTCRFVETEAGTVVYSRALDDRLGAYIILDLLPKLGITCDILLTVGEEVGRSTAAYFDAPKDYHWVIEFDRGGTDVVMYQYEDEATAELVRDCGARVGEGILSDISYLDHLGVKAFNWGVGYQDYHSARSHAYLDDTFAMVARFVEFYLTNADTVLPHETFCEQPSGMLSWPEDPEDPEDRDDRDAETMKWLDADGNEIVDPDEIDDLGDYYDFMKAKSRSTTQWWASHSWS